MDQPVLCLCKTDNLALFRHFVMSRLPQRCVIGSNFFRNFYVLHQQGDSQKLNKNYLEQIKSIRESSP